MATTNSRIEWTDATWNPVAGCSAVSPGCHNCYAARMALRLMHMPNGTGEKYRGTARRAKSGRPVFTGAIHLDYGALGTPRKWRSPRMIFVNSMSDLFHEDVPTEFVRSVFDVMVECPQHTFQILTKRPCRASEIADCLPWPPNVWLGTSVESARYYERVRILQKMKHPLVRFLSCEPLLGPLNRLPLKGIDWVIVGGESGPGARPMMREWLINIKRQCRSKDVSFFFKQWGGVNKKAAGRTLYGRTWNEFPNVALTVGATGG